MLSSRRIVRHIAACCSLRSSVSGKDGSDTWRLLQRMRTPNRAPRCAWRGEHLNLTRPTYRQPYRGSAEAQCRLLRDGRGHTRQQLTSKRRRPGRVVMSHGGLSQPESRSHRLGGRSEPDLEALRDVPPRWSPKSGCRLTRY